MNDNLVSDITVYLCFWGYEGSPDDITHSVGITPSSVHRVGEYQPRRSIPTSRSFWSAKLRQEKGNDAGKLIDEAVSALNVKSAEVEAIASRTNNESYVVVTIALGIGKPSIDISNYTLKAMAKMGLSLDVGIFD